MRDAETTTSVQSAMEKTALYVIPAAMRFQIIATELEQVRERLCPYPPNGTGCDCKYGVGYGTRLGSSEKTGCPELREIIAIYRNAAQGNQGG